MTGFTESFRGDVSPWEVDATEHFTVAYYYEKFEAACWRTLVAAGVDPAAARTTHALTHYKAELRNRDIYRIETGLLEAGDKPVLGHRLYNAETGALCTIMRQSLSNVTLNGPVASWDGDPWEDRGVPAAGSGWRAATLDVVRPEEVDWAGRLSLPGYIHRFSAANSFIISAFGMTPDYLVSNRIGLSTFEFQLTFQRPVGPGALLNVESCIAHLGGSSLRLCHRMQDGKTGEPVAELSQFAVHLDLDARRPSRIPDALRTRAEALIAGA